MEQETKFRTCNVCNWVHFGVSYDYAKKSVAQFNRYFRKLSAEQQQDYYGGKPSSIKQYKFCNVCSNPYTNFRPSKPGDCPSGCTIGPIIHEPGKTKK